MTSTAERARPPAVPALLAHVAVAVALAVLGATTTLGDTGAALERGPQVAWRPPVPAIVVIWTVLFLLQALAAWLVQRRGREIPVGPSLPLYWAFVALQALWLVLLLLRVDLRVVLGVIVLTDLAGAATAFAFWQARRLAGALVTASVLWLLFGTALSAVGNALRGL